jgi:hypothetical protein
MASANVLARQDHRIAAAFAVTGADNGLTAAGGKGLDKPVEMLRPQRRHVPEQHQRADTRCRAARPARIAATTPSPWQMSGLCDQIQIQALRGWRRSPRRDVRSPHGSRPPWTKARCGPFRRISASPSNSANSLCPASPPMRLARPAASSTTPTVGAVRLFSCRLTGCLGCGRVGISFKSPPTPMREISSDDERLSRKNACQYPVKSVLPGAAGTARRTDDRYLANGSQHQQVAGIDRHADPFHLAAGRARLLPE